MASELRYSDLHTAFIGHLATAEDYVDKMLARRRIGDQHAKCLGNLAGYSASDALKFAIVVAAYERSGGYIGEPVFPLPKQRSPRKRKGVAA